MARAQQRPHDTTGPCASVGGHERDTVVVFQPPSTFSICRHGKLQDDVVTGRPVYFELAPAPNAELFDFRIHGQASEWKATGLSAWEDEADLVTRKLRDVEQAGEPISSLTVPTDASASSASGLKALAAARARYLFDATDRFLDAVHEVRAPSRDLSVIAGVVRKWCAALGKESLPAPAAAELSARCARPELTPALDADVAAFEEASTKLTAAQRAARESLAAAVARPDDAGLVSQATRDLDAAQHAAEAVALRAHTVRESSRALERDVAQVRATVRSLNALRPGVPTYLTTFTEGGNAELEIDAAPIEIATLGHDTREATTGKATARFPVVARHYLDVEAGLGLTVGLPGLPYVGTVSNVATIQSKPVDEFVGLALVELEPLRFLYPDKPAAGLLRFPAIAIPFTRDPTQNYFLGGGIGWTGVGSIIGGPYLLRELTLRDGYETGEALPNGTSIVGATVPALRVGAFVSASVDLLGLFRAFVPAHAAALDGTTGKEK